MNEVTPHIRADALEATTPILDVRRRPHIRQIRGALRYDPEALLAAERLALPFDKRQRIAVYSDSDDLLEGVIAKLRHGGYDAAVLEGGIETWYENDLPVEEIAPERSQTCN